MADNKETRRAGQRDRAPMVIFSAENTLENTPNLANLQARHFSRRFGLPPARAALVASHFFGEVRR